MTSLQVYQMVAKIEKSDTLKATTVNELPDESNLVIINGTLSLVDGYNNTIYSIDDILRTLENQCDRFSTNNLESNVLTAVYNLFDQLKDEYSE